MTKLLNLETITKEQYDKMFIEEDALLTAECEDCGWFQEGDFDAEEEINGVGECPDCGGDSVMNSTEHEGQNCAACDHEFVMYENNTLSVSDVAVDPDRTLLCSDCTARLELLMKTA